MAPAVASGAVSVALVDDDTVTRAGVATVLAAEPGVTIVAETSTGEYVLRLLARLRPDVAIVEARSPAAGPSLVESIRQRHPRIRVVAITSAPPDRLIVDTFAAGAKAFVTKESEPSVLVAALRAVLRGETYVDPRIGAKVVALATQGKRRKGPHGLTAQEMRVLEALPRGLTNRQIAQELGLSEETVKSHLRHAMAKLGVHRREEAVDVVGRDGIV